MYNREDPVQHAALVAEIKNDPKGLGLPAMAHVANDAGGAAALNALNGPGVGPVPSDPVTIQQFNDAILDGVEYNGFNASKLAVLNSWIDGRTTIDLAAALSTNRFLDSFLSQAECPRSRANAIAASTQTGSRAEVLFGVGTVITAEDFGDAR